MGELYNYKLWNPNLNQFVAQPDRRTAEHIHSVGGVIIFDGGHPMSGVSSTEQHAAQPVGATMHELTAP